MKDAVRTMAIVDRIAAVKDLLEGVKPLYDELDILTLELKDLVNVGETLSTEDKRFVTLIDNYSEKNTVFRVAAVRRYEVELCTVEEMVKKQNKAAKASKKV
jgi:hypothetical protein